MAGCLQRALRFGALLVSLSLMGLSGASLHAQTPGATPAPQSPWVFPPSKNSGPLPVVELGRPSKESADEQARRRTRENFRKNDLSLGLGDPDIQEMTLPRIECIICVENPDPSIPPNFVAAVVVGTVINASGYVSEDRKHVYSDYAIRVDEILKQDATANLKLGASLIVSRHGATVLFPSGLIRHYVVMGRGALKVGAQYLLFLWKLDAALIDYEVLDGNAFELTQGKAYRLDDEGCDTYNLAKETDAARLLAKTRALVSAEKAEKPK